jgi:hypothetical protein
VFLHLSKVPAFQSRNAVSNVLIYAHHPGWLLLDQKWWQLAIGVMFRFAALNPSIGFAEGRKGGPK